MKTINYKAGEFTRDQGKKLNGFNKICAMLSVKSFRKGAAYAQEWIPVGQELPPIDGQELLLKNEKWVDEDYNKEGVRAGSYGEDGIWTSAYWCGIHDEYHTRTSEEDDHQFKDFLAINQIPTHWRPFTKK